MFTLNLKMFNSSDDQTYALLERNNFVVPVHLRTILSSLNLLRPREYNSVGGRGHCGSCCFRKFRSGDPKGQGRSVLRVSGEVSAEDIKKINAYCLSPRFEGQKTPFVCPQLEIFLRQRVEGDETIRPLGKGSENDPTP